MSKTAGIIIIGDEILTGKIQDNNAFFMAKELWAHGIQLCRISVIQDNIDEIAAEVNLFSNKFDYVFTSGGIGPTHDDVTIEGIAKAFNVRTIIDDTLKGIVEKKLGNLSPEKLKMAEAPEGAELFTDGNLSFPLIKFRNIYIFPGIPELLRKKFFAIEKLFDEPNIYLKKIFLRESESEIAPILKDVLRQFRLVKIGSYPIMNIKEYCVVITMESLDEKNLQNAVDMLLHKIPRQAVFKVE